MADKRLNDVSTASNGAYVYAEDASGNQIKISKADLATVVAEQFIVNNEPQFSIATNHNTMIGIVWGRDYDNVNNVAYIFVGSVGGKKVFMYEIGKQGNPSITATISGRDITFTPNSLDEIAYFKF